MTKKHFVRAAEMVKAIRDGGWTHEAPEWAPTPYGHDLEVSTEDMGNLLVDYVRAVQTAEAFILLFREFNPRFNQQTFLRACGLVE
jgi:hypothetical protein